MGQLRRPLQRTLPIVLIQFRRRNPKPRQTVIPNRKITRNSLDDDSIAGTDFNSVAKLDTANLEHFAHGICGIALEKYDGILKTLGKDMEEERLVYVFLGRPKSEKKWGPTIKEAATYKYELKDLLVTLENHISIMTQHKMYDVIMVDLILQVLCYVDEIVFNQLIDIKSLNYTDGVNIKLRVTELDHWWADKCASKVEKRNGYKPHSPTSVMRYVHEVANLLMVEKERLDSEEFVSANFPFLKPVQILRILEIFKADKIVKKQVSNTVLKTLQNMVKAALHNSGGGSDSSGALYVSYARKFHLLD